MVTSNFELQVPLIVLGVGYFQIYFIIKEASDDIFLARVYKDALKKSF